jgi:starch synthase
VLVEHELFASAAEPYNATVDPLTVAERFALFARASLHYARQWEADVIHLNDWQTGLAPVYSHVDRIPIPTVFSIHNLAYQGNYPVSVLNRIGVPPTFFRTENGIEFFGNASFIKGGIALADRITTVSPTYAGEIQTPELGAGFDGLLRFRNRYLHGILNGIDVESWNPQTDAALSVRYGVRSAERKDENRSALLNELQLDDTGPLLIIVSRLAHQKGIDIFAAALPALLDLGVSIAVLGDGDTATEQVFSRIASANPRRVAAFFKFDDPLSRRFYAGGDFFIMPSRYEPCGLGQMLAQRYGTIPVVRRTGGLIDTVEDGATGFQFDEPTSDALLGAVRRALAVWRRKDWLKMRRRCMRLDRSWGRSAEKYEEVYRAALGPVSS